MDDGLDTTWPGRGRGHAPGRYTKNTESTGTVDLDGREKRGRLRLVADGCEFTYLA